MSRIIELHYQVKLYDNYGIKLKNFIYRYNPSYVEDILQNVFEKLLKIPPDKLPQNQQERHNYIFAIAKHEAINFNKKLKRRKQAESESAQNSCTFSSPHKSFENSDMFQAAIQTLSKNNAEAITLKFDGYRYKEIAEILGISESAVKQRIKRAEAQIKQFYLSQDKERHNYDE